MDILEVVNWWDVTILKSNPNNRHMPFISHFPITFPPWTYIGTGWLVGSWNLTHFISPCRQKFPVKKRRSFRNRHWVRNELHHLRRLIPHRCATSSEALETKRRSCHANGTTENWNIWDLEAWNRSGDQENTGPKHSQGSIPRILLRKSSS
jgi:hypothetical protein